MLNRMKRCDMAVRDGEAVDRPAHWSDQEVDEGAFKDARLGRRFADMLIPGEAAHQNEMMSPVAPE